MALSETARCRWACKPLYGMIFRQLEHDSKPSRGITRGVHFIEQFLLFEGVHAGPEARIAVPNELIFGDEALEWLVHQLFAGLHIVKDFLAKSKEAPVDPQIGIDNGLNAGNRAVFTQANYVERLGRLHAEEAGNLVLGIKVLHVGIKIQVGQAIAVVGQEDLFPFR